MKLDLACGQNKKEGFTGIDSSPCEGVDIVHNLLSAPWPIESDSVEEVHCSHFFEHIPGKERPKFMEELYRVMKVGAKATFLVPYYSSFRAIQDFTHEWPPVCEASFLYFNKQWMKDNKLTHYNVNCDFDFTYGYSVSPDWAVRSQDSQSFAFKNYLNSISDLIVTLIKREKEAV